MLPVCALLAAQGRPQGLIANRWEGCLSIPRGSEAEITGQDKTSLSVCLGAVSSNRVVPSLAEVGILSRLPSERVS